MKIISLHQPYATLVVIAAKLIETRSFDTKYRGPLLIHASKAQSAAAKEMHTYAHRHFDLPRLPLLYEQLPFGAIIGSVTLTETKATPDPFGKTNGFWHNEISDQEFAFGDYAPGRFGWLLEDAVQFAHPIPAKGQQGFWNFEMPDHLHSALPGGGHATFSTPPSKETLEAVHEMVSLARQKFSLNTLAKR